MNNIKGFNVNRCDRTYAIDTLCTTTSATTTTTTTTTTQTPTSAATVRHTSVITNGKTTGTKTGTSKYDEQTSPWPATGKSSLPPQSAHSSTPVREQVTLGSTTNDVGGMTHDKDNILPSFEPSITPKEVVGPIAEDKTTIYVCVGAAVLLLIVIAALVLICRSRSAVLGGVKLRKKPKLQHQKSDLQPITSHQDDMCRTPTPSIASTNGSWRYSRDFVTNGQKWRPEYSSDDGISEHGSMRSSKYLIMHEGSLARQASMGNEFHFNTLKALDHPNAIVLGGFGESSTDQTLPRNSHAESKENHGLVIEVDSQMVTFKPTSSSSRSRSSSSSSSGSLMRIDSGIEVSETLKSKAQVTEVSGPMDTIRDSGCSSPSHTESDPDTKSVDSIDKAIQDWKNEIKRENMKCFDDELVNSTNEHLFAYENKALLKSNPDISATILQAPTFDDSNLSPASNTILHTIKPTEANVAVVQPNQRLSVKNLKNIFEKHVTDATMTNNTQSLPRRGVATVRTFSNGKYATSERSTNKIDYPDINEDPKLNGHLKYQGATQGATTTNNSTIPDINVIHQWYGSKPSAHVSPQVHNAHIARDADIAL